MTTEQFDQPEALDFRLAKSRVFPVPQVRATLRDPAIDRLDVPRELAGDDACVAAGEHFP